MNHEQVMRQALEALEKAKPMPRPRDDDYAEQGWTEHHAAITALRKALAFEMKEEKFMTDTRKGKY